jgi:hypothetical protein
MNIARIRFSIIATLMLFIQAIHVSGQPKNSAQNKWVFHSYTAAGILTGKSGPAFQCQTVNGLGNKSWYAGVGVAMDYYKFRTVPLFIDLKKTFLWKSFGLFAYADGGIEFPWPTEKQHFFYDGDLSNGFYGDFGLGILIPHGKTTNVFFSFGYSVKEAKEENSSHNYCPFAGPCFPGNSIVFYQLNRFSFKMGISF